MRISNGARNDCLFCQIVAGTVPSTKVYADQRVVAFEDIHPAAPVHVLLVPRKHIASVADLEPADEQLVGEMVWRAKLIAAERGVAEDGYRLVFNVRKHGGQVIDHLHLHLLGGKRLGSMT